MSLKAFMFFSRRRTGRWCALLASCRSTLQFEDLEANYLRSNYLQPLFWVLFHKLIWQLRIKHSFAKQSDFFRQNGVNYFTHMLSTKILLNYPSKIIFRLKIYELRQPKRCQQMPAGWGHYWPSDQRKSRTLLRIGQTDLKSVQKYPKCNDF